jgi:cytochrome b561
MGQQLYAAISFLGVFMVGALFAQTANGTPNPNEWISGLGIAANGGIAVALVVVFRLFLQRIRESEEQAQKERELDRKDRAANQAAFQSQIAVLSTQMDQRERQSREDMRSLLGQVVSAVQALDNRVREDQSTAREMQAAIRELERTMRDLQEEVKSNRRAPT